MAEPIIIDLEPRIKDSLNIALKLEVVEKSLLKTSKERIKDRVKENELGRDLGKTMDKPSIKKGLASMIGAAGGKGLSAFAAMTSGGPVAGIAALGGPLAGIGAAVATITSAVSKANPAVMELFGLAIDDFIGVIGQALAPIVAAATEIIRELGDVVASLLPLFQPIIDLLVWGLKKVAVGIRIAIDAIIDLYNSLSDIIKRWTKGFIDLGHLQKRTAMGAAAREASFVSIADLATQAQQKAFSIPPAERTAAGVERLVAFEEQKRGQRQASNQQLVNRQSIVGY